MQSRAHVAMISFDGCCDVRIALVAGEKACTCIGHADVASIVGVIAGSYSNIELLCVALLLLLARAPP